jgi:hypothetical protein
MELISPSKEGNSTSHAFVENPGNIAVLKKKIMNFIITNQV